MQAQCPEYRQDQRANWHLIPCQKGQEALPQEAVARALPYGDSRAADREVRQTKAAGNTNTRADPMRSSFATDPESIDPGDRHTRENELVQGLANPRS